MLESIYSEAQKVGMWNKVGIGMSMVLGFFMRYLKGIMFQLSGFYYIGCVVEGSCLAWCFQQAEKLCRCRPKMLDRILENQNVNEMDMDRDARV